MPVRQLDEQLRFPSPEEATPDGLVAVGGDLSPERLVLAYRSGIFPWPHDDLPLLWFSPDPRMVLRPDELRVTRSLRTTLRRGVYEVRFDTAFEHVVAGCAGVPRAGQDGTWITPEVAAAYVRLHRMGLAHSAEAWRDGELVGGLYGVALGRAFFGESMFSVARDASKVALATLAGWLAEQDFALIDCQQDTPHMARLGARPWPRRRFLQTLARAVEPPDLLGPWTAPEELALEAGQLA